MLTLKKMQDTGANHALEGKLTRLRAKWPQRSKAA